MNTSSTTLKHSAVVLSALLVLAGCAGPKGQYPAAAEAQQRMAAEAASTQKGITSIDTQATYLKLVEQMQADGLWFASLAHIDALEQRWGVSPESSRARADALRQTGEGARSEETYRRLMGTPLEAAGYHGLGLLAGARGNYAEAVRLLKEAQRRNPADAVLLSDLGYASLRAGLVAEARLPLMQALQLKSDNPQAQANLALYLEVTQQRAQADALMEAKRMSPATRAAIRESAQQLGAAPLASSAPAPASATATAAPRLVVTTAGSIDDGVAPLRLKAARWSGMGGAQAIAGPAATANSSSTTSRGTE
jgi:Flp pilus assembly protein TadD